MRLKALTAEEALTKFAALAAEIWPDQDVTLSVNTGIQNLMTSVEGPVHQLRAQQPYKEFAASVSGRRTVHATGATLKLRNQNNRGFDYSCGDELTGTFNLQNPSSATEAASWLSVVEKHFDVTSYLDHLGSRAATAAEGNALQVRERAVADMQAATAKLGDLLARIAKDDAEERRKLNAQLEADYREKADKLNAQHQERLEELEAKRRAYEDAAVEREHTFAKEKATFETSEAKLVRRRMLSKLEEVLAKSEAMKLSPETSDKRKIVHYFTWMLLGGSAILATVMGWKVASAEHPDMHHVVPMVTGTVTFFASLVYYLKWNDRWFREHAEAELAAKRYQADIVRANWLAELVAEQKQLDAELPAPLLDAFTRNLFHGSTTIAEAEHPFEQITGLIRRAKKLEVGGGKFLVDIGKRKDKPTREE